jgi:Putative transposase
VGIVCQHRSVIHRVIAGFLVKRAGFKLSRADTGAVTLIQRFGSAANLNIHLHCLVLDGVYLNRDGAAVFHEAAPPSTDELEAVLLKIIKRTMRLLTRLGVLIEEPEGSYLGETDSDGALRSLQAASCTYRIALGPRAGQKVLSLQSLPSQARPSTPELRVNAQGFSLHAAVRWRADQRAELEQLCRYITRPAIANERLKRNRAGQVVLQLKSPYKDGTTHIVMEPLEFMERLAALVPRPRLHLIRFHGVLAPNAKLRSKIVPAPPQRATEPPTDHAQGQGETPRMSWARLLKRVFDIDIEHCPNCGGSLKIIAAIEDPPVIVKILTHLSLPTRAPPRAPAQRFDLFQTT